MQDPPSEDVPPSPQTASHGADRLLTHSEMQSLVPIPSAGSGCLGVFGAFESEGEETFLSATEDAEGCCGAHDIADSAIPRTIPVPRAARWIVIASLTSRTCT